MASPLGFLYGSTPAQFKSAFALEESVERLRSATKRSAFSVLAHQAAVGTVTSRSVRLQRVIPMVGNSFKPFFIGRFENRDDGVYLSGRFTMLPWVKVFLTAWLGMAIGGSFAVTVRTPAARLAPLAIAGIGIAMVALGKWFARNDIAWLSDAIRTALAAASPYEPAKVDEFPGTPLVLRIVAGVLAFMGILNVVNFATWSSTGPAAALYRDPLLRTALPVLGVAMVVLAIGVYRRRLLAWRLGLVFIGAAACIGYYPLWRPDAFPGPPLPFRIFFGVAMLVVWFLWGRWWYAQRVHFLPEDA